MRTGVLDRSARSGVRPQPARSAPFASLAHPLAPAGTLLALLLGAMGCLTYPSSDDRLSEESVVTYYDPDAAFRAYRTFAISSDVMQFSEEGGMLEKQPLDPAVAAQLTDKIVESLKERGYTQVERDQQPDLAVTASVLKGTVVGYYADYWRAYWGYPYYWNYYPYYYSYAYDTGTVLVDAVDLKDTQPNSADGGLPDMGEVNVSWIGLVYGVLSDDGSQSVANALEGIDQAFKQSPYFRSE